MSIKSLPAIKFYKTLNLLFVFAFCANALAQSAATFSTVKWEGYSVKDYDLSFLMPKLPVVVNESSYCRGEESFSYGSYAAGTAFVVKITRKIDVPRGCAEKKKFDKNRFNERVSALKTTALNLKERENGNSNEIILEGNKRVHKLVNDAKNDRWFEMLVVNGDETKPEVKNFLASIKFKEPTSGIEIGSGASQTLGDAPEQTFDNGLNAGETGEKDKKESWQLPSSKNSQIDGSRNSTVTPETESSSNKPAIEGVMVVLKPRANYTDMARRNLTQGKVTLRVTFSANGGIGAISVIRGLPDGLTEQAIAAARRLVFIPARRNGVHYSVSKPVEYTFTIY